MIVRIGARPDVSPHPRLRVATGLSVAVMLIAAAGCAHAGESTARAVSASPPDSVATACDSLTTCYTPYQLRVAYGIQPLLDRGIDGRGKTIVVPALAAEQPAPPKVSDIRQDMRRFDDLFGLPAVRLKVDATLAGKVSPWLATGEEVQDVQILHAVAPAATIRVVLVKPTALSSPASAMAALTGALRRGLSSADVISISAGWGEHCLTRAQVARQHAVLQAARDRDVTVVAGSGDTGAVSRPCPGSTPQDPWAPVKEVSAPASDPLVLAAGGTTFTADHKTGAYTGETTWSVPSHSQGTGGGFSHLFSRPGYQKGVTSTARAVPDVAADAAPSTGMAMVISENDQEYTIHGASGTSASTPLWAGLIALADQAAGHDVGFVNPAIYRIGHSSARRTAFHDVTTGNNTVTVSDKTITGYQAIPGYDPVTGWGSPNARVLVPLLARYAAGRAR
ncbi:S53 family peptidase [Actinoallomurus purpureus]|uniref:S53 family peptidase n=1 Tax=Actinoallomurus purpureus TaxID=478114 RepID=UPI002091F6C5|nr:S53 family peptidase [Actinoallomurus purpureus]MCO6004574.1 S53 family peptidase [Actinoallomurus purpureus]